MGKDNKDSKLDFKGIQLSGLGANVKGAVENAAAREAAEKKEKIQIQIRTERKQLYCQLFVMLGVVALMCFVMYFIAKGQNPYPDVKNG